MNYMIVYSSLTGNTKTIAEAIKNTLKQDTCTYFGEIEGAINNGADFIFVGFSIHKGSCDDDVKQYLEGLENQKIALFGTAGFGGSTSYFESIIENIVSYIPKSNNFLGSFMCQGKMTENVLARYSKMLEAKPGDSEVINMIDNYNKAVSHPDKNDIKELEVFAEKVVKNLNS